MIPWKKIPLLVYWSLYVSRHRLEEPAASSPSSRPYDLTQHISIHITSLHSDLSKVTYKCEHKSRSLQCLFFIFLLSHISLSLLFAMHCSYSVGYFPSFSHSHFKCNEDVRFSSQLLHFIGYCFPTEFLLGIYNRLFIAYCRAYIH